MLRKIVDWINAVAATGLGLYLLLLCLLGPGRLEGWPACVTESGWWWLLAFAAGLVFVAANALLLVQAWRGGDLARNLRVTTEGGSTAMSIVALERELAANLSRQKDIASPRVTLEQQANGLPVVCRLSFRLADRNDVLARVDLLKRQVREMFMAMFPGGIGLEIHAEVQGFSGNGQIVTPTETAAAAAEMEESKREFSGPVFPIPPASDEPHVEREEAEAAPAVDAPHREDEEEQPV